MSLLEDIFLQDEADEAQQLERVLEGDEVDERPRSDSDDNSEKEDEAEEDKRKVEPAVAKSKRVIKNPRCVLNPARLTGPRGIQVVSDHFKDFKFKGKGHEKEDLDLILKRLEHWAYRLYPKFQFEDCLKKIESLGKKRPVRVHLHKIRTDQFVSEDTVVQKDSSDEDIPTARPEEDEFDRLLQQQIDLARSTPAPNSTTKIRNDTENGTTSVTKVISSPSISDEQKERILKNRKLAEERRLARLKNATKQFDNSESIVNENNVAITDTDEDIVTRIRKHNKSNIIDSSDDEDSVAIVNESVTIDVHLYSNNDKSLKDREENNKIATNSVNLTSESLITYNDSVSDKIPSSDDAARNDVEGDENATKITETPPEFNKHSAEMNDSNKMDLQDNNKDTVEDVCNVENNHEIPADHGTDAVEVMDVDFSEEF